MCYFELRQISESPTANIAADIAKHLVSRQHLGKTVVICERPLNLMSVVRKHWFRRARQLQRERSSTVNVEKILRLTNSITHMHRMRFAAKPPQQQPNAHVYFMLPEELDLLPNNVYSFYSTVATPPDVLKNALEQLPEKALLIDYTDSISMKEFTVQPKQRLYTQTRSAWRKVDAFFKKHKLDVEVLAAPSTANQDAIDDALDTLLGVSQPFLEVASDFQHALELAQPVNLSAVEQRQYDLLILLAHRVQSLSPTTTSYHFTPKLNDEETFFLHDVSLENLSFAEALEQTIAYHKEAGRKRLARALAMAMY